MRKAAAAAVAVLAVGLLGLASCQEHEASFARQEEGRMFEPANMRVHPIFTQVKDWSGDGGNDGVEAVVEFTDAFGDPTKASGQLLFELYEFRAKSPDPRGRRVVNPWVGSLVNADEQRAHWSRPARSYSFQLAYPQVDAHKTYVLTATFEKEGGGRFFGQTVIEGERSATSRPVERVHKGLLK
jgi:hypothetical protein